MYVALAQTIAAFLERARSAQVQKIGIHLENCYGIKQLNAELDFSGTPVYAIYAPNGAMKSSLAKTFQDVADRTESQDRIFPKRKTIREIVDEHGHEIEAENVLVVTPYDEEFGVNEKTSTLLLDAKLKQEYERLLHDEAAARLELLTAIQQQSQTKTDIGVEIANAITQTTSGLDRALIRLESEVHDQADTPFADVPYDKIYNEKVLTALDSKDLKDAIEEYAQRYDELLSGSTYFRKGTFDYYNAAQIARNLTNNGFFEAEHTVRLNAATGSREIRNSAELEELISEEKNAILSDSSLRKKFDDVGRQLMRNVQLREFYDYVRDNEALLSRLKNPALLRQEIIKSYIKAHEGLYDAWLSKHRAAQTRRNELEIEAREQRTQWEEVIRIFNDRFFVPFTLEAKNKIDVLLGQTSIIELGFTYSDGDEHADLQRSELLNSLSTGERKALYILNVIFEVETRRKNNQEALIVIDDLADSFDYRNKYAIVQYLWDISDYDQFKLIIMTHNFDFLRTIQSRFVKYNSCLMASRNDEGVNLAPASGVKNVFARDWKNEFFSDAKKKIACIPFLRNIVEMTTGERDARYEQLTSVLHFKPEVSSMSIAELDVIFCDICGIEHAPVGNTELVHDLIIEQAENCLTAGTEDGLERKVVLAIAIRLLAEQFVIEQIQEPDFVRSINAHQTQALIQRYKSKFPADVERIRMLERVALMTPESIHLNSFMYEPLVDMSDEHLQRLFSEIRSISESSAV
ncbi:MAG: hypothetical protein OXB99_14690 [Acidimicrobiaceae bacterium]|nr:hypothetical protein [Acidimicrobiaceae bacterium]